MTSTPEPANEQQQHERAAQTHASRWDPGTVRFKPGELERQLHTGMEVKDLNDDSIGSIDEIFRPTTQTDRGTQLYELYVKVDRGWLSKDIYVPSRFIGSLDENAIRLTVPKDEIPHFTWDRPEFIPESE